MPFISIAFASFYSVTVLLYYVFKRNYKWQNILLLLASYVFYAYWDWRFLGLLILSGIVNFCAGKIISLNEDPSRRKIWLSLSLLYNLLILGIFKYFNFFEDSLLRMFGMFGLKIDAVTLTIILPLGISYYTFQSLSYPLDIYRRKLNPIKSILDFSLFTSFFPTIVSGPIERANHLLPQIQGPRTIDISKINTGLFLIIWGCFQKLVIANNMGLVADQIFNNYGQYHGLDIIAGVLAFTIQIFCDFSGYTDIARGIAQLLGFDLFLNFRAPYFAKNPADFWGRWHISLSSWLRDYLYIPLGGNRKGKLRTYFNLLLTMAICGLWHGAAWNYIIWGMYHGVLLCIYRVSDVGLGADIKSDHPVSPFVNLSKILLMFILVSAGWAIFRSTSFNEIVYIFTNLNFSTSINTAEFFIKIGFFGVLAVFVHILQYRDDNYHLITSLNPWIFGMILGVIIIAIIIFAPREVARFIYQGF